MPEKTKTGNKDGKASKGSKASKAKANDTKQEHKKLAIEGGNTNETTAVVEPVKSLAEIKQGFTVQDLKDKEYKIRPYNLFYNFTETELRGKSNELADETIEKVRLEEKKKESNADFKAKIEKKSANINLLSQHISSGKEMRDIKCRVYLNQPIEGQKTIVRTDTEEIVSIVEMEAFEFQEELNLIAPESTDKEGANDTETKSGGVTDLPTEDNEQNQDQENTGNIVDMNPEDNQ